MNDTKKAGDVVELLRGMQDEIDQIKAEQSKAPEPDPEPILKGNRTIITGWVTALAPVAALLGMEYDPEAVNSFIDEFRQLLMVGFVALGAFIHKFRNKA